MEVTLPEPSGMRHIYDEGYVIPDDETLVQYTHFHVVPRTVKGNSVTFSRTCRFDFGDGDDEKIAAAIREASAANPVIIRDGRI